MEPYLGLGREHAAIAATVWQQLALALIALVAGAVLFDRAPHLDRPTPAEMAQSALAVILVVVFATHVLPSILFHRTRGRWAGRLLWIIFPLVWMVTPVTVLIRFFFSLVSLAEESATPEEVTAVDVEALLEAGEEEGILEQNDLDLVRSAVEFGDKLVREVMTPRPRIVAVEQTTSLEKFLELHQEHKFSRVPVFDQVLDHVTGIAMAADLLEIADGELRTRTVSSIAREVAFVPETKRTYELLREMQREHQQLSIVIDEYGGVAGLVTIEDLLEEIVGEIRDEHDEESSADAFEAEPERDAEGAWSVPGGLAVNRLEDLFGVMPDLGEEFEATTLGGLVSEREGRIPHAGEVILLEPAKLRIEVLASTDRHMERLRVFPPPTASAE